MAIIKERIEWVDIFKALVICSMVIGHATGKFNGYIYQFHMAAFFFISGYTASIQKKSFFEVLWRKWFSLMLPFYTIFFLFVFFVWLLYKFNIYSFLFSSPYPGLLFTIQQFFNYGNVYIEWLGATWFIPVLYVIHLVQKVILIISKK